MARAKLRCIMGWVGLKTAIGKKLYSSEEEKANKKGKLKLPEASNNSKNSQEFESSWLLLRMQNPADFTFFFHFLVINNITL